MPIELPKPTLDLLTASVQRYLRDEMDLDSGELQARLLLEFVVAEVGPTIYNRAIAHAQAYMQDRVLDLEGTCHEDEMPWWEARKRRR